MIDCDKELGHEGFRVPAPLLAACVGWWSDIVLSVMRLSNSKLDAAERT